MGEFDFEVAVKEYLKTLEDVKVCQRRLEEAQRNARVLEASIKEKSDSLRRRIVGEEFWKAASEAIQNNIY